MTSVGKQTTLFGELAREGDEGAGHDVHWNQLRKSDWPPSLTDLSPVWSQLLRAHWQSEVGQALSRKLAAHLAADKVIYPRTPYKALELTPFDQVRVVILGQDPYHGPGQVIVYVLIDLARRQLNIRSLVSVLENTVIGLLAEYGIHATSKKDAPGVYVQTEDGQEAKIASLGLRIKNDRCYHGLSLNVDMDLAPYSRINPCGYAGLATVDMAQCGVQASWPSVASTLAACSPPITEMRALGQENRKRGE